MRGTSLSSLKFAFLTFPDKAERGGFAFMQYTKIDRKIGAGMSRVIRIERKEPRPGGDELPCVYRDGWYQLVGPGFLKEERNKVKNATFVSTLDEAAELIERGFSIRMGRPGIPCNYIALKSLRIVRA